MNLILNSVEVLDILDILIVAFVMYYLYRLLQRTRAVPVIIGLLVIFLIAWSSKVLNLETISWLFEVFSNYFIIGVLITLQPEMRRFLYRIGEGGWIRKFYHVSRIDIEEILQAVKNMGEEKLGALIVIINKTGLDQIVESGVPLRAYLSKELLVSIFYNKNPLHDGAVIVQGKEIISASTYLPMSNSAELKKSHGARHRAGLGISEESDALVIILSEEKRKVSLAFLGHFKENVDMEILQLILSAFNDNSLNETWAGLFGTKRNRRSRKNRRKSSVESQTKA